MHLHGKKVRTESNIGAVERDRVTGIAHDRNGDKTNRADAGAGGVEIDPTDARQVDLRPGMRRSTS